MEQRTLITHSRKLQFGKFMTEDPFMMFSYGLPLGLFVLFLIAIFFGRYRSFNADTVWQWFLAGTLISLVVMLPIALWRLYRVNRVLQQGVVVDGEITGLSFNRYFGRVVWQYEYQNQSYKGATFVTPMSSARDLELGEILRVIVHLQHPQQSVIRYLYCKTEDEEQDLETV